MTKKAGFSVRESGGKVLLTVSGTTYRLKASDAALLSQKLSDASGEAIKNNSSGDNLRDLADLIDGLTKGKK